MQVLHQAPERFALARARWRLVDLRQALPWLAHYTLAGLWQALRRLGGRPKRGRLSLHSPDGHYEQKVFAVAQAVAVARRHPARVRVLYADEVSFYRQPTLAPVAYPRGEEPTAPLAHAANTRHRLSGALDVVSGQVHYTSGAKMGGAGLCQFLRRLRAAYPTQILVLVWDNWPVHRHADVLALAAQLHIHLLWLPTYAPWTNPIEKLWRWLKQTLSHFHHHADHWDQLTAASHAFLDQFAEGSTALLHYVGLLPL